MYSKEQEKKYREAVALRKAGWTYASIAKKFEVCSVLGKGYVLRGENILDAEKYGLDATKAPPVIIALVKEHGIDGLKRMIENKEHIPCVGRKAIRLFYESIGLEQPEQAIKTKKFRHLSDKVETIYIKALECIGFKIIRPQE